MHPLLVVAKKEILDNLRDRRSVLMALLFPLFGPLSQAGILATAGKSTQEKLDAPIELAVSGVEHAPALAEHLRGYDVALHETDKVETLIEDRTVDVGLVITDDFSNALSEPRPANLRIVFDDSRRDADKAARRLHKLLDAYGARVSATRLLLRGVDPALMQPLAVVTRDVSSASSRAAQLFGTMPFFLVMALFLGGFYVAVDTTAGERERLSLEPLLAVPVPRSALAIGKLLAAWVFSLLSLEVSLFGFWFIFNRLPTDALGAQVDLDALRALQMLVVLLPTTLLASAVQMWIACLSRTTKEAQTYLGLLILGPMIPGMLLAVGALDKNRALLWLPTCGEQLIIDRLLRDQPTAWLDRLTLLGTTAALTLCLLWLVVRLFEREKMV